MFAPHEALERARSMIGKGTAYKLGDSVPGDSCDCSGFTCWAYGYKRRDPVNFGEEDGGWHYTDAIVRDALDDQDFYALLPMPVPGCLVVYPGITQRVMGKPKRVRIGHIGMISHVPDYWDFNMAGLRVIHCSGGNMRATGDAIRETGAGVWAHKQNRKGVTSKKWRSIFVQPLGSLKG